MDDKGKKVDLGEINLDVKIENLELEVETNTSPDNSDVETLDFGGSDSGKNDINDSSPNSMDNNTNDMVDNSSNNDFADDIQDIPDNSQENNAGNEISNDSSLNHSEAPAGEGSGFNDEQHANNADRKGEPAPTASKNLNENPQKKDGDDANKNTDTDPNKNDDLNKKENDPNNQNKNEQDPKNPEGASKQNEGPNNSNNNTQNNNNNNNSPDKPNENKQPQKNEPQKDKAIDKKRNEAKQKNENLKNKKPNNNKPNNAIKNKSGGKGNKNFAKNYAKNKFNNTKLGSKVGNVADKVQKAQKAVKTVKNIKNIKNIAVIGGGLISALPVIIGILAAIFLVAIIMAILSPSGEAANVSSSGYSDYTGGYYCTNITVGDTSYELEEYVARVIAQELGGANTEGLKAQSVLARTFVLNSTSDGNCSIGNSQSQQTLKTGEISDKYREAANATAGEVLTHDGKLTGAYYATFPTGVVGSQDWGEGGCGAITCQNGSCTTKFYKYPSKTAWDFTMPEKNKNGNYWNGSSLTNQSGHCHGASQLGIMYYDEQGEKYNEILARFFDSDVKLSKLESGSGAAGSIAYTGEGTFKGQINYYNQLDYNTTGYCGRTPGAYAYYGCNQNTICTSGCGSTSLAIIASSLKNDTSLTPIKIMSYVKKHGGCGPGISGSTIAGLVGGAKDLGLTAYHTNKKKEVAEKLATGDYLVIANVTESEFTGGGHYIVLSGYKSGQVYVLDPNGGAKTSMPNSQKLASRLTKRDRNGWWPESAVFDYAPNGYIIIGKQ